MVNAAPTKSLIWFYADPRTILKAFRWVLLPDHFQLYQFLSKAAMVRPLELVANFFHLQAGSGRLSHISFVAHGYDFLLSSE